MRNAFFTSYAAVVGAVLSAVPLYLLHSPVLAAVGAIVCAWICGSVGKYLAKESQISVALGLIAVPWLSVGGILVAAVTFGVIVALAAGLRPVCLVLLFVSNRRLRSKLNVQGRVMRLGELHQHLAAGEGTLIEEWGKIPLLAVLKAALLSALRFSTAEFWEIAKPGAFRVWWTADDLLAKGLPRATDAVYASIVADEADNWHVPAVKQYLDRDLGRASLVLPAPRRVASLQKQFPRARTTVMVTCCLHANKSIGNG